MAAILAITDEGSDSVSILLGKAHGAFDAVHGYHTGDAPRAIAVGDFDHDGDADLAVADAGADAVSVLLNTGTGAFAAKAVPARRFGA